MRKKRASLALIAVIVVAVGLRGWKVLSGGKKAPSFRTVAVERGDVRDSILATGVVQPQNRVEIKPPIGGRADEIFVKEGQAVRKGQMLAYMSSTERAALLDAARAKGPAEVAHWEDLYKPTPLIAPLDGVVITRDIEPGQTVTAQDAVLVMSNRLIVKAQVDETDIGRVRVGQKASLTLDAYPDLAFPASADHIAFEATTVNNVTVYQVDVKPEKAPGEMRSGMTANVSFLAEERKGVLVLPAEAVREGERGSFVLVPGEGKKGRPDRRKIETGLTDGRVVEVTEGLKEGDQVLVEKVSFSGERSKTASSPFSPFGGGAPRGGGGGGRR